MSKKKKNKENYNSCHCGPVDYSSLTDEELDEPVKREDERWSKLTDEEKLAEMSRFCEN